MDDNKININLDSNKLRKIIDEQFDALNLDLDSLLAKKNGKRRPRHLSGL